VTAANGVGHGIDLGDAVVDDGDFGDDFAGWPRRREATEAPMRSRPALPAETSALVFSAATAMMAGGAGEFGAGGGDLAGGGRR